jgi:hypothetical protein
MQSSKGSRSAAKCSEFFDYEKKNAVFPSAAVSGLRKKEASWTAKKAS